jgi:uncharacterized protein YutE (UPF0331/DUF86 family)
VLDRERVLAKIDELEGYPGEMREIAPASFEDCMRIGKRRACERLLQISIETILYSSFWLHASGWDWQQMRTCLKSSQVLGFSPERWWRERSG